jgi:hypothetical protein
MIAFATVLHENDSLKAFCIDSPLLFSVQEETTGHFARMLKVRLKQDWCVVYGVWLDLSSDVVVYAEVLQNM